LTSVAFLHSTTDELFHHRPEEEILDASISHWKTRMVTYRTIMQSCCDSCLKRDTVTQPMGPR
jgi:hypothetical protein